MNRVQLQIVFKNFKPKRKRQKWKSQTQKFKKFKNIENITYDLIFPFTYLIPTDAIQKQNMKYNNNYLTDRMIKK